jgi:hypothetical protein
MSWALLGVSASRPASTYRRTTSSIAARIQRDPPAIIAALPDAFARSVTSTVDGDDDWGPRTR